MLLPCSQPLRRTWTEPDCAPGALGRLAATPAHTHESASRRDWLVQGAGGAAGLGAAATLGLLTL